MLDPVTTSPSADGFAMLDKQRTYGLAPLEEFMAGATITRSVTSLNRFEFTVFYQNTQLITSKPIVDKIVAEGLQAINEALKASLIFQLHDLKVEVQAFRKDRLKTDQAIVTFNFDHDRLHCQFIVYNDRFRILRRDSSFENFYEWYQRIMPHAVQIEATIRRLIERHANQALEVVQSIYEYKLNFGDFETRANVNGSPRRRNVDVLKAIIPSLPDERGEMREISDQDFYRINLTLSRLERFTGGKTRNAWYFLEAPFNENGRYLVLRAQLRNASTELPGTDSNKPADVSVFDPDFGDDYRLALNEFLRDRALEGFARRFLETWNFVTPRVF